MTSANLTIGVPTRNRAALVRKVVEQCLAQTRMPLRIVVSDNASEDGTLDCLAELSNPYLKVLRQPRNVGMVGNWNACLNAAEGEWFVLLSDDDLIAPDFVEQIEMALALAPTVDLLIMRCRIANTLTGQVQENDPPTDFRGELNILDHLLPAWLKGCFNLPLLGMVFRRSALIASGGFSSALPFAADVATWLPICVHGRCSFWPNAVADYVVHPGMTTNAYPLQSLIDDVIAIGALVSAEIGETSIDLSKKKMFDELSNRYVLRNFSEIMNRAMRRGTPKRVLLQAWMRSAMRVPRFGFSALTIASALFPRPVLDLVGAPYRKWGIWKGHGTRNTHTRAAP